MLRSFEEIERLKKATEIDIVEGSKPEVTPNQHHHQDQEI